VQNFFSFALSAVPPRLAVGAKRAADLSGRAFAVLHHRSHCLRGLQVLFINQAIEFLSDEPPLEVAQVRPCLFASRGLERVYDEPVFGIAKAPLTLKGHLQAGD